MNRGFWFVAGAGAGVYAVARARRAAEALTVDGLRDRVSGLALGARLLAEEVAQGQAEKETELRERFGLVPHGVPQLETSSQGGGRHRALSGTTQTTKTTQSSRSSRTGQSEEGSS